MAPLIAAAALLAVYLPHAALLAVIDAREHRLPNRIVASMSLGVLAVSGLCALLLPTERPGILAAIALAALAAVLGITMALIAPQLIGMGDAKAAPAMVLVSAAIGWDVLIGALLGVALLGGAVGTVLLLRARDARARFAYGPVLLAGPLLGLLLAPLVRAALGV